ncbi:MAG: hypothetical protein D6815_08875 [Candidatus Dadabacteria bacterium]|nr:MAG: hypothetical protein D6815_08875 [Candidatus Dadabacteria bacterium]
MAASLQEEARRLRKRLEAQNADPVTVALFGQPGAGKSSLINKLVGRPLATVGQKTDQTVQAQIVEWEGLRLVDLPGYGTSKFPPNAWIKKFDPRSFDMFLCVFSGKFHSADTKMFHDLEAKGRTCLFVRQKSDTIWQEGKSQEELRAEIVEDVRRQVGKSVDVYFVSCVSGEGLGDLSDAIFARLPDAKRDRWSLSAKAYTRNALKRKKEAARERVRLHAGLAAANALNPIPGADIAIDVGNLLKLFEEIRKAYGITDRDLQTPIAPELVQVANRIIRWGTKDGLLALLKRYAARQTAERAAKYIPLVGQAIAGMLGFAIAQRAGMDYLDQCHSLAEAILNEALQHDG